MDVIITVLGEFSWTSSCVIVNLCLSSGLSAIVVFVSFLCVILASAFYKYMITRERKLLDDTDKFATVIFSTIQTSMRSPPSFIESTNTNYINNINPLSEIEISNDQNTSENEEDNEQISNDMIIYTTEDSEDEIQTKPIKNIYHLLNDNNLTVTDFCDQLKMYGLQIDDQTELKFS